MVVMHRRAYPAPGEINCPLEVQLSMKILNPENKLQCAVYNHLLKFVLSKLWSSVVQLCWFCLERRLFLCTRRSLGIKYLTLKFPLKCERAQASQVPECRWLFLSLLTHHSTLTTIDFYPLLSILLHVPL